MADNIDYTNIDANELVIREADQLLIVQNLRREVTEAAAESIDALMAREDELMAAEDTLYTIRTAIPKAKKRAIEAEEKAKAQAKAEVEAEAIPKTLTPGGATGNAPVMRSGKKKTYRSAFSTEETVKDFHFDVAGLGVNLRVHMPQVPTAIYHMLDSVEDPLISCELTNQNTKASKRLLVRAYIESYTAEAVHTIELERRGEAIVRLLPTLFPERVKTIQAATRATLHVIVEDIDKNSAIFHITEPIWLLSRTSAPQAVKDPVTEEWNDLTRYLGAYVTPNAPSVMRFLRDVARYHHNGRLVGYQDEVESQAMAIYEALRKEKDITYVDSLIDFNPEERIKSQRVRLPRESLEDSTANCIDGALLFASLLQGISINPCIVLVPRHAFVGWETDSRNDDWQYLETTMLQTHDFYKALEIGNRRTATYMKRYKATQDPAWFRQWSLRDLRALYGIMPME